MVNHIKPFPDPSQWGMYGLKHPTNEVERMSLCEIDSLSWEGLESSLGLKNVS